MRMRVVKALLVTGLILEAPERATAQQSDVWEFSFVCRHRRRSRWQDLREYDVTHYGPIFGLRFHWGG
jgi:hypothetical protein